MVDRAVRAGAVVVGKANLPEFAWSVLGQNPWYGTVHNPAQPGKTTGGSSSGNAAALAAGLVELGIGSDTGCSIRLPVGRLRDGRAEVALGRDPDGRRLPALPDARHGRADGAHGRGRRALLVGARRDGRCPSRGSTGSPSGCSGSRPGSATAARPRRATSRRRGSPTSSGSAPASSRPRFPDATANTWPQFLHEAKESHAATFPSRADEYGDVMRTKLETASRVDPDEVAAAYAAIAEWRRYEPEVDLYVSPCYAVELPPEDATRRRSGCRSRRSSAGST